MGFTVNDTLEIGNTGVTLNQFYINFGRETLRLRGNSNGTYNVECMAKIYRNKASYKAGKAPIDVLLAQEVITENQLNGNLFKRLYNILKAKYTGTSDD